MVSAALFQVVTLSSSPMKTMPKPSIVPSTPVVPSQAKMPRYTYSLCHIFCYSLGPYIIHNNQCCGSGSGRIRDLFARSDNDPELDIVLDLEADLTYIISLEILKKLKKFSRRPIMHT